VGGSGALFGPRAVSTGFDHPKNEWNLFHPNDGDGTPILIRFSHGESPVSETPIIWEDYIGIGVPSLGVSKPNAINVQVWENSTTIPPISGEIGMV